MSVTMVPLPEQYTTFDLFKANCWPSFAECDKVARAIYAKYKDCHPSLGAYYFAIRKEIDHAVTEAIKHDIDKPDRDFVRLSGVEL